MKNIKQKDFVKSKDIIIYYIFGTTRTDEAIKEVIYNCVNDKNELLWGHISSESLANSILNMKIAAYAGERKSDKDGYYIENPSLVVLATTEDKLILKTANDPDKDNNLLSLPIYEIYKDKDGKERYRLKK